MFYKFTMQNTTHRNRSGIHDKDTVTVHDCVKTMSNGQHRAVSELATNCCLYKFISPEFRKIKCDNIQN
jgi:hypothetical protein